MSGFCPENTIKERSGIIRLVRPVVLIGPVCVGKTTLLPLLASRLDRPSVDLDDVAEPYYEEVGRSREKLNVIGAQRGDLGAYLWWQEAHPHAVRRVVEDHPDAVIALGAGHTTYTDAGLFEEVRSLLQPCATVLLLPSRDNEESLRLLRQRAIALNGMDWVMDGVDVLEQWVAGEQNRLLASVTIYTDGLTPDDLVTVTLEGLRALPDPPADRR